jgi:hypothetical protein
MVGHGDIRIGRDVGMKNPRRPVIPGGAACRSIAAEAIEQAVEGGFPFFR